MTDFPLGLAYIGGSISNKTNWDVKIFNADFSKTDKKKKVSYLAGKGYKRYIKNLNNIDYSVWQNIAAVIQEYQPDVIGITTVSSTFRSTLNTAAIAKTIDKNIKVILGGPYPTSAKKEIMSSNLFDISVIGEGEQTIVEILNCFENSIPLQNVNGIIFKESDKIIENNRREYIQNLDELPFPIVVARMALIDFEFYPLSAFQNILTTRGCPYNCSFCASKLIWTRKTRSRSIDNVISEIQTLRIAGLKKLRFIDDTFGYNKKYFENLLSRMSRSFTDLKWTCLTRADVISNNFLLSMKKAGCETIQIGIESGNNEILRKMNKGITVSQALRACNLIKLYDIKLHTFFLIGYPYETEETLSDTLKIMKTSKSDNIIYSIFTPYPYTPLYDFCKKEGLINNNYDVTLYNHQNPNNSFNLNIEQEKFKKLARKTEKFVDRYNYKMKLNRYLRVIFIKLKKISLIFNILKVKENKSIVGITYNSNLAD